MKTTNDHVPTIVTPQASKTTRLGLFTTLRAAVPADAASASATTTAAMEEPSTGGDKKILTGLHVTSLKSNDRRQIMQNNMMRVKLYFTDPRQPTPLDFEKLVRSKLNVFGKRGVFSRSSSFTGLLVSQTKVFGVCLQTYMDQQALKKPDLKVPEFVEKLCQHIEEHGLTTDGLFRIPGSVKNIKAAKDFIDKTGHLPDMNSLSIHDCTALLKMFLRELPEPLLTNRMYPYFIAAASKLTK